MSGIMRARRAWLSWLLAVRPLLLTSGLLSALLRPLLSARLTAWRRGEGCRSRGHRQRDCDCRYACKLFCHIAFHENHSILFRMASYALHMIAPGYDYFTLFFEVFV